MSFSIFPQIGHLLKEDFETVIIIIHNYATLKHIPTETHECKDPVTRKQTKKS